MRVFVTGATDTAPDGLVATIERSDAVVNLAGEPLMWGAVGDDAMNPWSTQQFETDSGGRSRNCER